MAKILMVGSIPPPYHGQSIAFKSAIVALSSNEIRVFESSFKNGTSISIYKFIRYFILLPFVLVKFRPDTIYFLCSRTNIGSLRDLYLLLLIYFTDVNVINHLHGSDLNLFINSLPTPIKKFFLFMYKRVNRHIVLVEGMKSQFDGVCSHDNLAVIPNFYSNIDPTEQSHDDDFPKLEILGDVLNIVYLSSVMKTKGVLELIRAVKLLRAKNVSINLYIAGDYLGDEYMSESEIKDAVEDEISDINYIKYVGYVNKNQKYQLLKQCQIFALPSYYRSEAVPLSIIEAMAMGCAIIASDYRYLPDIVKNNVNGKLVNPGDSDSIVQAISEFVVNPEALINIAEHNILEAQQKYSEEQYHNNIRKELIES